MRLAQLLRIRGFLAERETRLAQLDENRSFKAPWTSSYRHCSRHVPTPFTAAASRRARQAPMPLLLSLAVLPDRLSAAAYAAGLRSLRSSGSAPRWALHAPPPSALRTAHAIEPSAVRSAPVAPPPPHAAAPLPPHAAPPRRPCERCRSYHATARARDYILVAGGKRWTEGLVGGVDGLGRLVGGY